MFGETLVTYPKLGVFLALGCLATSFAVPFIWSQIKEEDLKTSTCADYILLHLLVMFCIATVGGIIDSMWISTLIIGMNTEQLSTIYDYIALAFAVVLFFCLPVFLTYFVGYWIMGLTKFKEKRSQIIFIATFLISITFFTGYILKCENNFETTTEVIEQTEERELVFFYELPVQQISGTIYGDSIRGHGTVSGEIFTVDVVPYVYLNAEGKGEWGAAPTVDSDITFFAEKDIPKIVIVTKVSREVKTNHTTGTSEVINEKKTVEYHFYLPQSILQTFEAE